MSRIIILGAGVSGHTAASFVRRWLDKNHEAVVVSPLADYNWIPSNIWVGVGLVTRFMRTFLPYQMWRFAWINLRMMGIIRASHKGQH